MAFNVTYTEDDTLNYKMHLTFNGKINYPNEIIIYKLAFKV